MSKKVKKVVRRRVWVDSKVQGTLVRRLVFYWFVFLAVFLMQFAFWSVFIDPLRPVRDTLDDVMHRALPALLASVWLLPVVLFDIVKISHRFAGPIFRLRSALGELAAGAEPKEIQFRDDDHWREMAVAFNSVCARLRTAERRLAERGGNDDASARNDADLVGSTRDS